MPQKQPPARMTVSRVACGAIAFRPEAASSEPEAAGWNTAVIRTMAAVERRFRMPHQPTPVRSPAVDGGVAPEIVERA